MDSAWALRCSTALVLVFLSSASKDEAMLEQRDVTFDLDKLIQGFQQPESFMLQKEVDLADIDPKEFPMQQMIVDPPDHLMRGESVPGVLTPRGSRPRFGPRSFPSLEQYPVQFPLSRPTSDNIQAICLQGDHRPRYPNSYFPNSGFGQQRRRAAAVNNAEAWFSTCCKENQTSETDVVLCCATQAWELSVELFCEEDGSVKDRLYHCCKRRGTDRLSCFNDDASNPNYEATEVLPVPSLPSAANFIFEPNNCQRFWVALGMQQMIVDPPDHLMRGEFVPEALTPRGSRPRFGPRSFPSLEKYPVQFPLSRPTSDNIQAICLQGDHRPRYPNSYFPNSGFGQQRRRAAAVNNAEAWFSTCCKENQTSETDVVLCCATQAWELSIELFCEKDGSVKDRLYHCCKRRGTDRLSCFNDDASNPNYEATEVLPVPSLPSAANFIFEPNNCQRKPMAQYIPRAGRRMTVGKHFTSQKPDINFPPGRPTADNIESLCSNQKLRPLYNVKCLPSNGYDELARQAKTINRLEKGFKQCCRKTQGMLNCADQKWRQELHRFCVAMNSKHEPVDLHCCFSRESEDDAYSCFQTASPDPQYNMTSAPEELSLDKICDLHNIIKKRLPVGVPLKTFVSQCCPLSEQDTTTCLVQKLDEISQNLCSSEKTSSPAVRRCCKMTSQEEISQCVSKIVMNAIAKAAKKMRKRCPIS
ncbi:uncharacterized protein PAE49_004867 [Odontesthes bonariensis]|uniref:uncharacterized protein LOC142380040 n=1 Tax=Odontesthes bonariensis TaxID=219752 RepID=UPI003F58818B